MVRANRCCYANIYQTTIGPNVFGDDSYFVCCVRACVVRGRLKRKVIVLSVAIHGWGQTVNNSHTVIETRVWGKHVSSLLRAVVYFTIHNLSEPEPAFVCRAGWRGVMCLLHPSGVAPARYSRLVDIQAIDSRVDYVKMNRVVEYGGETCVEWTEWMNLTYSFTIYVPCCEASPQTLWAQHRLHRLCVCGFGNTPLAISHSQFHMNCGRYSLFMYL